jgi:sugar phosphate permease
LVAEQSSKPVLTERIEPYSWYVLGVLVLVYVLNFVDRQILSILAEDIKADLHLTDGDLGFLYGTAFGVFYALFGIPLGRLADNWNRVRLMTAALGAFVQSVNADGRESGSRYRRSNRRAIGLLADF